MLTGMGEMENEFESEFESEFEGAGEGELEGELEFEGESEFEGEGEFESEFESEFENELEGEGELEFEDGGQRESELEGLNPASRIYPDAMMEHMGLAAMEAETESEAAEHFLPLIPLVASKLLPMAAKALPSIARKVLPRVARAVSRATPSLTRGVTAIAKNLHRNPQARHLMRTIPSTARRAVATIAKHAAKGHPVTPRHAVKILARENRRVLHNPRIRHAVLRRAGAMDHKMHRLYGRHLPHRYAHGVHRTHGPSHHKYGPRHLQGQARGHSGHPVYGGGHPVYGARRAYAPVAGRTRVCPTCGSGARQGVRRVCCCC
jgi:hypothetical protein